MSLAVIVLGIVSAAVALMSLLSRSTWEPSAASVEPTVTLFVPCCGAEEGLRENLEALEAQVYPGLRICYIVERRDDGAVPIIEELGGAVVVAGPAEGRGQKVHNLLAAIDGAEPTDVWAFADSDGRPDPRWLARLVGALESGVGVASTYRFYVPEPTSFAILLRSVWNASVLSLLGDHPRNFAWGGGMAIRRETFDSVSVRDAWSGALSDDYALTHAVRRAGLKVRFVRDAVVPSYGRVGLGELMSWVTRQIKITRVYWPALFWTAAVHHSIYASFLVLGPCAAGRIGLGLWVGVVLMGVWTGSVRTREYPWVTKHRWAYATMFPLASLLTLQACARAIVSRRIEWRGRVYDMRSPNVTVIVD